MWFLALGLLSIGLKYFEVGMVAGLSWWIVLSPFAMALAWWAWADSSGYTKRRIMEREEQRKQDRINRQKTNMGVKPSNGPRR